MTRPQNTVFILSDEHHRGISGCYGHPFISTPAIDGLAARGTRFTDAYCNSPICVPSRAALATGRHVHRINCWDNATPYHGQIRTWHHAIRDAGRHAVSIGKLHFRATEDDNGFSEEILPMHVLGGKGDLKGLLRHNPPPKKNAAQMAADAGVGESDYYLFDKKIAQAAADWIGAAAQRPDDPPWVLFVSFVMPHFPLVAPEEFYALYENRSLDELRQGLDAPPPTNPVLAQLRRDFRYDDNFDDASRTVALRAYFGMVSTLDAHIGAVLAALETNGMTADTRVIYSSDHGDNLGSRGMWGKSVHYEDSVGIPMIAAGEGFPAGGVERTPVSLLDLYPTLLESTGVTESEPADIDGASLFSIVREPTDLERPILSQYHAVHSRGGHYMLRKGRWKFVYYLEGPPQLFDLENDPGELTDLGEDPAHADVRARLEQELRKIVDPEAANEQAFADQAEVIRANGGETAILADATEIPFTPTPK